MEHFTPENVLKFWQNPLHTPDFGGFCISLDFLFYRGGGYGH